MKKPSTRKEQSKTFLMVHDDILAMTHLPSLTEIDENGKPTQVEFTCTDKLLYLTMSKRFEFFTSEKQLNKVGSSYYDSHGDIARMCGVSTKTVTRFVKKWKDHGYIDYVNFIGNKANYTMIINLESKEGTEPVVPQPTQDEDYFSDRVYVNPEDEQDWRGY
jgi:hypothetical protein